MRALKDLQKKIDDLKMEKKFIHVVTVREIDGENEKQKVDEYKLTHKINPFDEITILIIK